MDHKESFLQFLKIEKRYSPHTVRSYLNDLDQFDNYLRLQNQSGNPDDLTSHDVRSWIVSLIGDGYSPSSIHRKISSLRVFYRFLRKEGLATGDPLEKVVLPKTGKRLPAFVEEKALDRLLDDCQFEDGFQRAEGQGDYRDALFHWNEKGGTDRTQKIRCRSHICICEGDRQKETSSGSSP